MANLYVGAIATALQEYNKYADPQKVISYQVYKDLAWAGLRNTPVFEDKFPIGNINRERILNRYRCELSGHSIGDGTTEA